MSEQKYTTSIHMSQSITGPLMNWQLQDWRRATKYITKLDGSKYTPMELKQVFINELAQGHECVPIGECDNFDYKKGCRGHYVITPTPVVRLDGEG